MEALFSIRVKPELWSDSHREKMTAGAAKELVHAMKKLAEGPRNSEFFTSRNVIFNISILTILFILGFHHTRVLSGV